MSRAMRIFGRPVHACPHHEGILPRLDIAFLSSEYFDTYSKGQVQRARWRNKGSELGGGLSPTTFNCIEVGVSSEVCCCYHWYSKTPTNILPCPQQKLISDRPTYLGLEMATSARFPAPDGRRVDYEAILKQ